MRLGIGRMRRAAKRLRNRVLGGRAVILLYHRVAALESDPFEVAVSPRHFEEQLQVLRQWANPIPLRRLTRALRDGEIPRRAVVVTFDDGYADNLHAAGPSLERYDMPATMFIASGYIGQDRGFWWDELADLLLRPVTLPRHLDLDLDGGPCRDDLGEAAYYTGKDRIRHGRWRCFSGEADPSPRHRLLRSLYDRLQPLPREAQLRALRALGAWAGAGPAARPESRPLTEDELVRLGAGPLIEIGAHTSHHALLAAQPPRAQRREIAEGKAWLEERLGRGVADFSYPHGSYTTETAAIVRDVGFASACCSRPSVIWRAVDPYELPRLCPGDWDGDQFARRLREWLLE